MRLPLSWLGEFVAVEVEPRRLADDLTAAGLAVDAIETVSEHLMAIDLHDNPFLFGGCGAARKQFDTDRVGVRVRCGN